MATDKSKHAINIQQEQDNHSKIATNAHPFFTPQSERKNANANKDKPTQLQTT